MTSIYDITKRKLVNVLNESKPLVNHTAFKTQGKGEIRQRMQKLVERKLSSAESLIKDLENESFKSSINLQAQMNREITNFKKEYESLKRSVYNQQMSRYGATNYNYEGAPINTNSSTNVQNTDERSPLLIQQQRLLQESTSTIENCNIIAHESEQIGNNIITTMDEQKEQLINTKNIVDNTTSHLKQSSNLISSIKRTTHQH